MLCVNSALESPRRWQMWLPKRSPALTTACKKPVLKFATFITILTLLWILIFKACPPACSASRSALTGEGSQHPASCSLGSARGENLGSSADYKSDCYQRLQVEPIGVHCTPIGST